VTTDATPAVHPLLQHIVTAAVHATGAAGGWLVALDEGSDQLVVVAAAGTRGVDRIGATVGDDDETSFAFVVSSGQPIALEQPQTVMCVPCEDDDLVVGAIELVDKIGGRFTLDDLEIVGVLADVAAVALRLGAGGAVLVPTPAELTRLLEDLARDDLVRYSHVAALITSLVERG
jgi:GAF domain-containing protein